MKTCWLPALALVLASFPVGLAGQGSGSPKALSSQQKEGRRVFQQKCALCHLPVGSGDGQPYAPKLSKAPVVRSEASARQLIENGSPLMPGWKYTLTADQITNILEYMKTLDLPPATVAAQLTEF